MTSNWFSKCWWEGVAAVFILPGLRLFLFCRGKVARVKTQKPRDHGLSTREPIASPLEIRINWYIYIYDAVYSWLQCLRFEQKQAGTTRKERLKHDCDYNILQVLLLRCKSASHIMLPPSSTFSPMIWTSAFIHWAVCLSMFLDKCFIKWSCCMLVCLVVFLVFC